MPVHAVHDPIAAPRSSPGKTAVMRASERRHEQRAGDALQRARRDQQLGARRERAQHRRQRRSPPARSMKIRCRPSRSPSEPPTSSSDAERQQVGLDDPLLRGEAGVEVLADRRQRDVDDRAVEEDDADAEDARRRA